MKEPHNDNPLPEIIPERDEFSGRATRATAKDRLVAESESADDASVRKSGNTMTILALLFAVAAVGGSGWLFTQFQVQQTELLAAQQRISDLELRLSATGEEMDQSAVALQVKVTELAKKADELWVQMDKLWASAWRRNQSEIKELEKSLESTESSLKSQVATFNKDISGFRANVEALSTSLDIVKEEIDLHKKSTQSITQSIDKATQSVSTSREDIRKLQQQLDSVLTANQRLQQRVTILEQWKNSSTPSGSPAN